MSTENPGVRLGDLLTSAGLLKIDALREAMLTAKQQNMPVGRILITSGYLTENQLQAAVQAQSLLKDGLVEMDIVVKALGILQKEQTSLEQAMARCGWHKENNAVTNKLGELLLEASIVSKQDLAHALEQCENIGLPLGRMLVLTNSLSEQMLSNALNAQVLLRDRKVTRAQAIRGLQAAQQRQLPLESTLAESDYLQLPSATNVRLGELLIEGGLIDQANLMNAVELGLVQEKLIGQVLRQLNLLAEKDLGAALELQKMVGIGTLRRREAVEILVQIHSGKATLQDILKRKQNPLDYIDDNSKDELFLDQFLRIAGIITQNDIDRAVKLGTQDSDIFGKMLQSAGVLEEQMVEASLDAYALVSDNTLTMDQAMIALKNCQVRGHSLEDAFKDLGWSADVDEELEKSQSEDFASASNHGAFENKAILNNATAAFESTFEPTLAASAKTSTDEQKDKENFAPVAVPIEPVAKPEPTPTSVTAALSAAASTSPQIDAASTQGTAINEALSPRAARAAAQNAQRGRPRNSSTALPAAAPVASGKTAPAYSAVASSSASAPVPVATSNASNAPIAAASTSSAVSTSPVSYSGSNSSPQPVTSPTHNAGNGTSSNGASQQAKNPVSRSGSFAAVSPPAVVPVNAQPQNNAPVRPTSGSFPPATEAQTRATSEFPTITPVVSKRSGGQTGEFPRHTGSHEALSNSLAPKPSYNDLTHSNSTSAPPVVPAKPDIPTIAPISQQPVKAETVESVRYGNPSKEFAPNSASASTSSNTAIEEIIAIVQPPVSNFAQSADSAPSAANQPIHMQQGTAQPVHVQPLPAQSMPVQFMPAQSMPAQPLQVQQPVEPPVIPQPQVQAPHILPPQNQSIALPQPIQQPTPSPVEKHRQAEFSANTEPSREVRATSANAISSLNASWGFGSESGPKSNPWEIVDEPGESAPATPIQQQAQSQPLRSLSSTSFYNTPALTAKDLEQISSPQKDMVSLESEDNYAATAGGAPNLQQTPPAPQNLQATPSLFSPSLQHLEVQTELPLRFDRADFNMPEPVAVPLLPIEQPVAAPQPSMSLQRTTGHIPFVSAPESEQTSGQGGWGGKTKGPPPNPWAAAQSGSGSSTGSYTVPDIEAQQPAPLPTSVVQAKPQQQALEVEPVKINQPTLGVPAALPGRSASAGENPGWPSQTPATSDNQLSSFSDNPGWRPAQAQAPEPPQSTKRYAPAQEIQSTEQQMPPKPTPAQPNFQNQNQPMAFPQMQSQQGLGGQQPQGFPPQQAQSGQQQQNLYPPQMQQQLQPQQLQPQQLPPQAAFPVQPQHQDAQQLFPPPMPHQQGQMQPQQPPQTFDQLHGQVQPGYSAQQPYGQLPQRSQEQPAAPTSPQPEGWEFAATEAPPPPSDKPKGLNAFMPKGKKDKPQ